MTSIDRPKADIIDTVINGLIEGKSLAAVCKALDVPRRTVRRWLVDDEELAAQYARAKVAQADAHADQIIDLAQRVIAGEVDPNAARVAIDAMKWTACKLGPRTYGDHLTLQGGDTPILLAHVDDTELARRVALLLSRQPGEQIEAKPQAIEIIDVGSRDESTEG